jgi:hypothetical protein
MRMQHEQTAVRFSTSNVIVTMAMRRRERFPGECMRTLMLLYETGGSVRGVQHQSA